MLRILFRRLVANLSHGGGERQEMRQKTLGRRRTTSQFPQSSFEPLVLYLGLLGRPIEKALYGALVAGLPESAQRILKVSLRGFGIKTKKCDLLSVMAMPWSRSTQGLPEIDSIEDCARLMKQELVILFKHSPTCPVSWMAHREVMQYRSAQPDTPLYLISVRRRREVARYIADETGIQHESPQVIVLRRGEVVASGSHDHITSDAIANFVARKASTQHSGLGTGAGPEPLPSTGS